MQQLPQLLILMIRLFSKYSASSSKMVTFYFKNKDNSLTKVTTPIGQNLLQIAHKNEVDLEGACEQSLACSTCHVILPKQLYDKLPQPVPEEEDLLDLAYGLTETSRLGCQVKVDEKFENVIIQLPKATRNFYVDGHKPKPH
ncbi:unnamed protein product (macronuclear) [Paramecium tetraurelia]|uniref:2Fe-2S ferredoxin n=1 Tax=Paramecium tetraurelia TaxID=5888 RepID=A0C3X5_PARTE|nr:uncharacterized protein GSPATT00034971001 [Paramecium tetraurelia]CAK65492.1 unnamed protein product [Paramecium tetraurelia]|eukprot:XP_001432889.1 hypothetical protein (macronuclear) [Paramecium tetraurelia strain d4-2]